MVICSLPCHRQDGLKWLRKRKRWVGPFQGLEFQVSSVLQLQGSEISGLLKLGVWTASVRRAARGVHPLRVSALAHNFRSVMSRVWRSS